MILHLPSPAHDIAAGIIEDTVETAARQLQLLQNVYPPGIWASRTRNSAAEREARPEPTR